MEFREANAALLTGFRRSMLRYAADLNGKIKGMDREAFILHRNSDRSRDGRVERHDERSRPSVAQARD
jgi:hypothetical protein